MKKLDINDIPNCPGYLVKKIARFQTGLDGKIKNIDVIHYDENICLFSTQRIEYQYEYNYIQLYENTMKKWFSLAEIETFPNLSYLNMHSFTYARLDIK